jgi:ferredoxin-NADP reductase/DMSO/TMAO reductase YedYZ heme-binding membrane subunit
MNTSDASGSARAPVAGAARTARFRPDPRLVRGLVLVNGVVPGLLLAYDALRGQLGANGTSYALHTTGLVALLFFVLSLAVTPLRRLTGWPELIAGRRALGLYGFFYLVVHFGIFCVFDRGGSLSSIVTEILKRRYLQIGTVALVSFVPLAVTATDRMITRLGPRRWKRLHRVSYVATSLGALHYILLVKSDLRQPAAFALVLGVLLGFRLVASRVDRRARAKKRPWSGELRIAKVIEETHDVRTFRFVPLGGAGAKMPFEHRAGQYLNLALEIDGQRVNRSYTIASAPTRSDYCEITVKKARAGGASSHLHETLREGAVVKVTAPAGRFVFDGEGDGRGVTRVLLVAGGVGITPLMAMVRTLSDRRWKGRIDLMYSVKTSNDVVFAKELEELVAKRSTDLHVHVTLTREPEKSGWTGARGAITHASIARVAGGASLREVPIYLCGPDAMMDAMKAVFAELGVPPENVHLEAFVSPPRGARAPETDASGAEEPVEEAEESPAQGRAVTVQFAASGINTSVEEGETLLDAAEEMGVDIPFDCRAGICGQCKTKLVSGRVVMDVQDALTADDRRRRLVLACQARPVRDVVVEA